MRMLCQLCYFQTCDWLLYWFTFILLVIGWVFSLGIGLCGLLCRYNSAVLVGILCIIMEVLLLLLENILWSRPPDTRDTAEDKMENLYYVVK